MHFHVLRFHFGALVSVSEWLEVGLKWVEMKFATNSASKSLRVVSGSHPKSRFGACKVVTSGTFPGTRTSLAALNFAFAQREDMDICGNTLLETRDGP